MNTNRVHFTLLYDTIFKDSINYIDIPKVQQEYVFVDICSQCEDNYIIV